MWSRCVCVCVFITQAVVSVSDLFSRSVCLLASLWVPQKVNHQYTLARPEQRYLCGYINAITYVDTFVPLHVWMHLCQYKCVCVRVCVRVCVCVCKVCTNNYAQIHKHVHGPGCSKFD
jgi:hypothetical protein